MKIHIILIIVSILFTNRVWAQRSSDSINSKKNELSIDLIPIIKIASDIAQDYNLKATIQYKRQIKKSLFVRLGITSMQKIQRQKYSTPSISYLDSIHDGATYHEYKYEPEFQINGGIEYRWGKKRVKQFTGLDIGYGYEKNTYTQYFKLTEKYAAFNPNFQTGEVHKPVANNDSIIRRHSTTENKICFTPFYGGQYHFSNRFFFSMQLGIQIQYVFGRNSSIDKNHTTSHSYIKGDFDIEHILNNFSLGYRF